MGGGRRRFRCGGGGGGGGGKGAKQQQQRAGIHRNLWGRRGCGAGKRLRPIERPID